MTYWNRPTTTFGTGYSPSRPTTIYPPNAWSPHKLYTTVLLLHQYASTGVSVKGRLDLDKAINYDDGVIIIAPDGRDDPLNAGNTYWEYWVAGGQDCLYLKAIIDDVTNAGWGVDPNRVYITGYSNGAFMTHRMVLDYPNLFSAGMSFCGCDDLTDSTGSVRSVPWIHFHGDADSTVIYGGDPLGLTIPGSMEGHGYVGATGTVLQHALRNGLVGSLSPEYQTLDMVTTGTPVGTGKETHCQAYSGASPQTAVELWRASGTFHTISVTVGASNNYYAWWQNNHNTPNAVTLSSIAVTPNNASTQVAATRQYAAIGTYSDASTKDLTATTSWDTDNHTFATIDSTGLLTGVGVGSFNVTATTVGIIGTVPATVQNVTLSTITVSPSPMVFIS